MKFLKSGFSKLHAVSALFAGVNIVLGFTLTFGIPFFGTAALLHFLTGLLLFIVPLLLSAFIKDFKTGIAGFKGRFFIKRKDLKNKTLFTAKLIGWIFLTGLILYALSGIIIKSGLGRLILPGTNLLMIHAKGIFIIPPLLILHIASMFTAYRKTKNKTQRPV